VSTDIVPVRTSIGNAGAAARDFARKGSISPTTQGSTAGSIGAPGANTEPVPLPPPGPEELDAGFLTADGQRDSHAVTLADGRHNGSPRAGQPYRRITWREIRQLVAAPAGRTKDRAALVILSTYAESDGRTHEIQRRRGWFGGLAVDIDRGSPSLEQVVAAVRSAVGDVEAMIYSSSSARPDAMKWRILFPLRGPLAGADYADTQAALFGLLEAEGLVCDVALARAAQPVFLPNVPPQRRAPDGRPVFYAWRHLQGPRLDLVSGCRIVDARDTLREKRAADEAEATRRAAESRERKAAHVAATGDDFDPIEHFKQNNRVGDLLARYGFTRSPRQRGSHWKSPLSESGSYSTEDRGDHWVTVSAWAHNHNIGRTSRNGHRYGDAFDLYAFFEHNGDRSAAVRAYAEEVRPRRPGIGGQLARSPAVRVEPLATVDHELVELEQYRRDIAQAVAAAVLDNRPGFKIVRGAPGTGKTYVVSRSVARYETGVTSVPGHELAGEVVQLLRDAGADAAAYPRLDERTCENYATASRAQAAGLSAPATVCPKCPLLRQCRERGYLAGVKAAEQAPHKVVTHSRLVRSAGRLLKNAEYLVLEEDPSAVLAPMISTTRRQLERLADLATVYGDAMSRVWILEGAADLAPVENLPEFDAWGLDEQVGEAGDTVPDETKSTDTVSVDPPPTRRSFPRGFFGHVCRVADTLATAAARALADEVADGVHPLELKLPPPRDLPKNPELVVWSALDAIDRVDPDATAGIGPDAMQLALAVATGRARRVYLQVETDTRPGGRRSVELVAQWRTDTGHKRLPVFVVDGTLDADILERLAFGGESGKLAAGMVEDITPPGRVPLAHYAAQYPVDVLPGTSSAKVAAMLAGIVRALPQYPRVGVLLHQRHYRELVESDDSPLPRDVRERIVWGSYFGSGADRGTNTLHRLADLAVVIGTHRPPPAEIRRTLARWGELEAAGGAATWGRIDRHGAAPDGAVVPYAGRGYADATWARAADATIRASMRQAVARSRAIVPDHGCAVVAVTTEAIGLPVLPVDALPVADDRAEQVVQAVARLAVDTARNGDKNPKKDIRHFVPVGPVGGVTLEAVAAGLPEIDYRTVKRWVARAVEAGDLVRTGNGKAVRYWLPGTAPTVVEAPASSPPRERKVATPAPAPLSLARVELPAPTVVEVARPAAPPPPPAPVVVTLSPSRSPVVEPARPAAPPPRPTPRPAVVAETQPPADWLERVLAPDRHPDERLVLEFYLSGPHARSIGIPAAWEQETPPLVMKLHKLATTEAKRHGHPPPPVEVVARHTVAWYARTLEAVAG